MPDPMRDTTPIGPCEVCGTELYSMQDYREPASEADNRPPVMLHMRSKGTTVADFADHSPRWCLSFKNKRAS